MLGGTERPNSALTSRLAASHMEEWFSIHFPGLVGPIMCPQKWASFPLCLGLLNKKSHTPGCWAVTVKGELCVVFSVTQSCLTLCNPMDCRLPGSSVHGIFPGKNTGVGCHFLLQGISSTPHLLHWQVGSLPLSHWGSLVLRVRWHYLHITD